MKIGSPSTEEVLKFPGFIDLTQVTAPGEIEIFLCGAAKFYLGSGSGPFYLVKLSKRFGATVVDVFVSSTQKTLQN